MTITNTILNRLIGLAIAAGAASVATAQPNVGPGELPLNAFVYKASHNSYERSETMTQQIQEYNTFFVELDMNWDNDVNGVMVEHFCSSAHNAQSLYTELAEIASPTVGRDQRIVIVYLEQKEADGPCYNDWPARTTYRQHIVDQLSATLGLQYIYPAEEFKDFDNQTWPSMQELNRRGYRYIVILDERPRSDDDLFFGVTTSPNPTAVNPNVVLINQENGNDGGGRDAYPTTTGARWLNRCYSDRDLCSLNNDAYWTDSVARRFNYVATNCVNEPETILDYSTHSPSPLYVNPSFTNSERWGTWSEPMTDLYFAMLRVTRGVTISAWTASYDVPNLVPISQPMTIEARGGPVTLR